MYQRSVSPSLSIILILSQFSSWRTTKLRHRNFEKKEIGLSLFKTHINNFRVHILDAVWSWTATSTIFLSLLTLYRSGKDQLIRSILFARKSLRWLLGTDLGARVLKCQEEDCAECSRSHGKSGNLVVYDYENEGLRYWLDITGRYTPMRRHLRMAWARRKSMHRFLNRRGYCSMGRGIGSGKSSFPTWQWKHPVVLIYANETIQ